MKNSTAQRGETGIRRMASENATKDSPGPSAEKTYNKMFSQLMHKGTQALKETTTTRGYRIDYRQQSLVKYVQYVCTYVYSTVYTRQ